MLLAGTVIVAFSIGMYGEEKGYFARTAYTLLAVLYIGKLLTYFVFIRQIPGNGIWMTYLVIVAIALTDIFAMLVGSTIGRHGLTRISPNKTIEGSIGSTVVVVLVATAASWIPQLHLAWWQGAALGFATNVAAQVGDLVESAFKRDAGVKDAGGDDRRPRRRARPLRFVSARRRRVLCDAPSHRRSAGPVSARKRVAILGSTGSIGTQALDVIAQQPRRVRGGRLGGGAKPRAARGSGARFRREVTSGAADGPAGLHRVAVESAPDIVLAATDGSVAFEAVFAAVERGIDVAVANKELVVAAGELLVERARRSGSRLLPVDSEHSAIFQCLVGEDCASVAEIC